MLGAARPLARNASIMSAECTVPGGPRSQRSPTNSARSILRRRAHRLCVPATMTNGSANRTSTSTSLPRMSPLANGVTHQCKKRSCFRSRKPECSQAVAVTSATRSTTPGKDFENAWMIGPRNVTEAATAQPIRTSPTAGSARNSMSLMPCRNSSNTARVRASSAAPYIVGSTPRGRRSKSRAPNVCSRSAITSDTEGCDMPSCEAALAMLPCSATVKNKWRSRSRRRRPIWLSESIFRGIGKSRW